jgi:hypothetical protein
MYMYESCSDDRVGWLIVVFRRHSCRFDDDEKESERKRVLKTITTEKAKK